MSRVNAVCPGDCASCELLARGEVDMVPCAIDQIFRIVRRQADELRELRATIAAEKKTPFRGVTNLNTENYDVQTND